MDRQIGVGTFKASARARQLVNSVLDSGRISYGPLSRELESRFAELHGCKYGVLSNSGTSSLLVALQTLKELNGWKDGDEVIVPALTFVATINIVLQAGLKPVLVDIEPDYYGIDISQIQRAKSYRTKCIIPVHTFGQPCDLLGVTDWAANYRLNVIEDSCEAMLVKHYDGYVWGNIACYSTYAAHLLVTGVGGMAITNNPDYARVMRSNVNHGIDISELPNGESYDPTWLARKFRFVRVGHSFRVSEFEAALGLAQLDDLGDTIKKRQQNYAYFNEALKSLEDKGLLQLPKTRPNTENSCMMYPVLILLESKHSFMRYLAEKGIGARDALPLTSQPVYQGLFNENDYPVAKFINEHGLYWGCHQDLTEEDLDYLVQVVYDYFG